jgi:hypothetical protein
VVSIHVRERLGEIRILLLRADPMIAILVRVKVVAIVTVVTVVLTIAIVVVTVALRSTTIARSRRLLWNITLAMKRILSLCLLSHHQTALPIPNMVRVPLSHQKMMIPLMNESAVGREG